MRLVHAACALVLILLVAPLPVSATAVGPGYDVSATRLSDGKPYFGRLGDEVDGRSWLWVAEPPYVEGPGERENIYLELTAVVERMPLVDGTLLERWTLPGGDHFVGVRSVVDDEAVFAETGTGAGIVAGFSLVAYER